MLFDLKNDMEEIWKTVKGYNGYYQVSNTGKVRNPNKVLTPNVGVKNGYVYVTLRKDKRLLHRIVAETFIPNPFNKPEVDHINGIRTDNNVCNLRWVTRTENNNNPITKSRFSKSAKGKVINAETKKRMSMSRKGEKHPMYNKKHSSFSKRKMSITHSIPVVQFGLQMNYIAEFESAKVASLETQVAASSINACTLGKRKTAGGYIWKKKMIFNLSNHYEIPKFKEYVNKLFSERAVVEVKKKLPNRTLAQNSYLHLLLGYFGSEYGCSLDEAKIDFYKRTCNRDLFERKTVNKKGNEVTYLRSSAELTTGEMTLSIDRFRNWSASVAGIYLPAANEQQMLIYAQQEIERNNEFI